MSAYDELGGHRTGPYTGAIENDCPHCGAKAGDRCTFVTGLGNTVTRHCPCVSRLRRLV